MRMSYEIRELPKEKYDYHELHYTYRSDYGYRAEVVNDTEGEIVFKYVKEKLDEPVLHDSYDTLYQEYWQECTAYGYFEDGENEPSAYLEVNREFWNSRLIITQLLVREDKRGNGIGTLLINKAKEIAENEDFRMISLETQTCNVPAIDFYRKCGFVFSGTNIFFYSNDDISENEVMLEMAYLL